MYRIYVNDNLIYDPTVEELGLLSAVLVKEDNNADNFTFTPSPKNETAQGFEKLVDLVEVFEDNDRVFRGRILKIEQDVNNIVTYTCEGELAFLADSIVRPYIWGDKGIGSGGVEAYLKWLIKQHNEQVSKERQFTVRNVTVIDPNDYIYRASIQYPSTMSELLEKLPSNMGGHIYLERIGDVTYLDYLEESPFFSNQTIRLGENILDLKYLVQGQDVATAVIPLGARILDDEGHETDERLTIKSVNAGLDYVSDKEAIEKYGYIFHVSIHDNITTPERLKTAGLRVLDQVVSPISSVEIKAIDLKEMGVDVDNIRFLDYVQVESTPHGIYGLLLINKVSKDLLNVANNTLTIGNAFGSFTKSTASAGNRIEYLENNMASAGQITRVHSDIEAILAELKNINGKIETLSDSLELKQAMLVAGDHIEIIDNPDGTATISVID